MIPKYSREAKVLYQGTREGKWQWTEAMEAARLKLIRMALNSGQLEKQDKKVLLEVNVHEEGDEVTLTLFNRDGKAPIVFLTQPQMALSEY